MPEYDFHQLSPYDLEILTRDLLQAHWGITIESFKSGKDGGIDLRYATGVEKLIVQVKHFAKTGLAGLLRELKKEAKKVRELQPSRYVVVTSVRLSAENKDTIVSIIGDDVLKPDDVIGCEGLNNLLGLHDEIEGKHYKLWLASRVVLDRVLNNAALTRSEFKVRQVYQDARRYVQSDAFPNALKMLSSQRVVIVAGPPGVGKSTLANLLLYQHLESGYQAVLIQRDIDEGLKLFQPGVPQVFYFDDFMGATFLGDRTATANGTDDRVLLEFIGMVRATPTARLILTTREHIYTQALDRSERLRLSDIGGLQVFLHMSDYSFTQKARILYNHLYHSDLPLSFQDELLCDDFYLRIIKHEKFNPRLIEWLSSFQRTKNIPVEKYRAFVESLLRDPSEIWRHAYEQEISDAGRSVLLTIFSLGGKALGVTLKAAFTSLHRERACRYQFETKPEDFRNALRELAGSFIKPVNTHNFEVIDPSVLDLLNAIVRRDTDNAVDIVESAATFDQIERLWSFAKAESGGSIVAALRLHEDRLAQTVQTRMLDGRRIDLGKGAVGYRGTTFERRLTVITDMADRLSSHAFCVLIGPLFCRLQQEWETERPEINDTVSMLRVLNGTRSVGQDELLLMKARIERALLDAASRDCSSDELRELLSVIDTSTEGTNLSLSAARSAFDRYRQSAFMNELGECRSREQFVALLDDLNFFNEQLSVDVDALLAKVEEAKAEYEEHEEAYADNMQDEWKERWRDERDTERSVTEMFGSLRGDRD